MYLARKQNAYAFNRLTIAVQLDETEVRLDGKGYKEIKKSKDFYS